MAEEQKSNQTLDLEARLAAEDGKVAEELPARDYGRPTEGFVGVSPEYQTYANETEKPFASEEGAEQVFEERAAAAVAEREENQAGISGVHGFTVGGKPAERNAEEAAKADAAKSKAAKAAPAKQTAPAPKPAQSGSAPS